LQILHAIKIKVDDYIIRIFFLPSNLVTRNTHFFSVNGITIKSFFPSFIVWNFVLYLEYKHKNYFIRM